MKTKHMNTKVKVSLYLSIAAVTSLVFAQLSGFASSTPRISAINAVAGYGTTLTVTGMDSYQPLLYVLSNPTGQQHTFNGYTDGNGSASYHVNETYLRVAGIYRIQAVETSGKLATKISMFTVYPDQASAQTSQFEISKTSVTVGSYDFALAKVRVIDSLGNPIPQHFVQIVSDRTGDMIKPYIDQQYSTNDQGEVTYALTSREAGTSQYTAFDLTAQTRIGSTLVVQYTRGGVSSTPSPIQGSFLQASVLGVGGDGLIADATPNAGPAYSFSFEQIPTSIKANQPIDFTVTAYDISQKVASGYLGTVHFSAMGSNNVYVSFPKDYTFTPSDLGKHIFPLSLQFQQEGTYQLQVQDTQKQTLLGIATVIVKGGTTDTGNGSSVVSITSPSPGSYSSNIQTISGNAPAGKDVKIYDNNEEIGTVVSSLKSQFEYTTQPLSDGPHEFAAISVDQKGVVIGSSDKVAITINTKPPSLQKVELVPGFSLTPGVPVQILVTSDPHMKSLILDMSGSQTTLTEDQNQPGLYTGSFASPATAGSYDLHFLITDALNNQSSVVYEQKLVISPDAAQSLKAVSNVKTEPGAYKVTLTWTDAENTATSVKNYKIFYGVSPTDLSSSVDTAGNVKTWYVPNLQNGVTYYFGIVAVDQSGNFGTGGTLAVGTPQDPAAIKGGLPAADTLISSDAVRGETGPEILWLFPLSFAAYRGIRRGARKLGRGAKAGRQ